MHAFTDGHLGCFQPLAIVNSAAVNIGMCKFFWLGVSGFLGYIPSTGIAGSKGSFVSRFFWGNYLQSPQAFFLFWWLEGALRGADLFYGGWGPGSPVKKIHLCSKLQQSQGAPVCPQQGDPSRTSPITHCSRGGKTPRLKEGNPGEIPVTRRLFLKNPPPLVPCSLMWNVTVRIMTGNIITAMSQQYNSY